MSDLRLSVFLLGLSCVACSSSQFSSKDSKTDQADEKISASGSKDSLSGQSDQSVNSSNRTYSGPPPSLSKEKIDKLIWHGCCPSYMQSSRDLAKNADRSKPNWAAKAYSKVERFYFERVDSNEYKLEKTIWGYFEDDGCTSPLSDSVIAEYKLKPNPKPTSASTSVKIFEISKDGSTAEGLHTVRDTRGGYVSLIDQKVNYSLQGSKLLEVITLDSKSFLEYEGYQIQCTLSPLRAKSEK